MIEGLFKKSNQKNVLSVDFGGEAVKAILFKKEKDKKSILGYSVQSFENFGIFDTSGLEQEKTKKIILNILEQIKDQSDKKIKEVCVRLPADILRGQVFSEVYKREGGKKKITSREENEIKKTVLERVKKEISKIYAQKTGIMPQDIYFLTLKIFESKIDGYKTPSLKGFSGQSLELKILATFLPKFYLENIIRIFRQLKLGKLRLSHTAELILNVIDRFKENCIFLDIGGDTTQIILFSGGRLEKIDEMPLGGRIVTKLISQFFGISEKEAKTLKEKYSNKELPEETRARVKEIISPTLQNWFCNLKLRLSRLRVFLPSDIYLFGGGSRLLGIEEVLADGDWAANPLAEASDLLRPHEPLVSEPKIKFISPAEVMSDINIPAELNNPQFTTIFLQIV